MKQIAIIVLFAFIPLILLCSVHNSKSLQNPTFSKPTLDRIVESTDRDWRLSEVLEEGFVNSDWVAENKKVYIYNPTYPAKIDTLKCFLFNSITETWELSWKDIFTYDSSGQFVTQIVWYDNWTSDLPVSKISLQYDNQHRLTSVIEESYDIFTLQWSLSSRNKMIYNTNSLNSSVEFSAAGVEGSAHWDRTIYTNDGQGRPVTETYQSSEDSLIWVNIIRTETSYHAHDTTTGDDFIESLAHLYESSAGLGDSFVANVAMVEQRTDQIYDSGWQNDYRYSFTYDAQDKLIEQVDLNWAGIWVNDFRMLVTYNADANVQQSSNDWWNGMGWEDLNRYIYTWGQTTAVDDNTSPAVEALHISASPNPFFGNVVLKVNSKTSQPVKLSVFNTKGQMIRTISAQANTKINWDGRDLNGKTVTPGIYLIRAGIADNCKTTKVLKLK